MAQVVDLWAKEGYISTPDGNCINIWGFTDNPDSSAQLPGPNLVFTQGEEVIINLHNNLPGENTSMLFLGQENVMYKENDDSWQRVQPQFNLDNLISFTNSTPVNETITYKFIANRPGTFLYESGTNPQKQIHMGLYGAMIIRPQNFNIDNKTVYGQGTGTGFDREYLLIVNEIDPEFHNAVQKGMPYDIRSYQPRYWTINGRCAPDSMLGDRVGYLPNQPYGSMVMMEPGEKVLLRYINAGIENHPLHLHGNHTRLIGLDGRQLKNGNTDLSHNRFTILMGAGQTYELLFEWTGLGYSTGNPIPSVLPSIRNLGVGEPGWTMWSGSPYLGGKGDIPVGVVSFNEMGEYYFMLHSHEEPQITNWGMFPGGMMTMLAIHPAGTLGPEVGTIEGEGISHEH